VLAELRSKDFGGGKTRLFKCRCRCGRIKTVRISNLLHKNAEFCRGCRPGNHLTHGLYGTPEYRCWRAMRDRCLNPKAPAYPDYGGRGIKIVKKWDDFLVFLADVGSRPSPQHTLDRFPDNDGDYRPGNIRWATQKEQCNNTRKTVRIKFKDQVRSVSEWADLLKIDRVTLWVRLFKYGWSVERALTEEVQKKKPYNTRRK